MDRLFWRTSAYQKCLDKIRASPFVSVTGSGGRGKSFLIRHIALELAQDGFEIIPVSSLEQVILYGKLNFKQLFIVDDVLGVYGLDMSLYNSFSRHSENLLNLLESGSKLMMSCRTVVFNESKLLNSFVTDDNHVINLDDKGNELNDEDVKNMLQNHCKYKNVREVCFEKLKLPSILPMFPLLCRVFSSTEKYQAMGNNFFLFPYQCMFSDLDNMQELNKVHYAGLVYCVIKDNCVRPKSFDRNCLKDVFECCRLNQSTSNSELVHAMQVLKGSYLMQDAEGRYFFIHDNFFEIVAVHFGKRFPECLIKHCTSCSIYKLLTIENTILDVKDDMIPIVEDHFLALVDRILCDIKDFKFYEVFSRIGHFWKCEKFVSTFCGTLEKLNFGEIRQLLFDVQKCEHEDKRQPFTEEARRSNE
ncbi:uncharacterized protein LOC134240019 [Saccostrea cucullata]|uniref:uncharacterized protein LOC134240019 n=1 Tax=Saccostrea cuccullata TaxID=36930 RepID=UPI002ED21D23